MRGEPPAAGGGSKGFDMPETETVFEPAIEESTGVFGALMDVYQRQGHEEGYQNALRDLRASLMFLTDRYLRQTGTEDPAIRRLIYRYAIYLEDHLPTRSTDSHYVSDGLGI